MFGSAFVVADAAAVLVDPGQAAFDDPSPMEHNRTDVRCESNDDVVGGPE